jgi:hypothetical protein
VEEAAMVDEQHGGAGAAVFDGQEGAYACLGVYDEPKGGFIEEVQRLLMQQGGKQFGLHALSEGKLAHGPGAFGSEEPHQLAGFHRAIRQIVGFYR